MNFKFVKRILITAFVAAMVIPVQQIVAAETASLLNATKQETASTLDENCLINAVAEIQKQENIEKTIKIETSEEIRFNDMMIGYVFANVTDDYLYIVETPDDESNWVGKVYTDSVLQITERGDVWCKIESGNVLGYIKTELLLTGKDAIAKAKELLAVAYPEKDALTLTNEEVEAGFSVGETREEEATRLAEAAAARKAAEKARKAAEEKARRQKGSKVVKYAKKFIGNPYVYGGTSLTRGTDCSGFVQGVYAHFGISLPRTSYEMRRVGHSVKFRDIRPGDIVCYSGHVGIYAGNGQIVNAINENKGIGMSSVKMKSIITIRRIY